MEGKDIKDTKYDVCRYKKNSCSREHSDWYQQKYCNNQNNSVKCSHNLVQSGRITYVTR
jgi:hypothetical protein